MPLRKAEAKGLSKHMAGEICGAVLTFVALGWRFKLADSTPPYTQYPLA